MFVTGSVLRLIETFPRAMASQNEAEFIWPKVQCLFRSEICTPDRRGGEQGGSANFKTKRTEPLT